MRLGLGEIAFLLALALALFGAKRLPEIGRAFGLSIAEFKNALNGNAGSAAQAGEPAETAEKKA